LIPIDTPAFIEELDDSAKNLVKRASFFKLGGSLPTIKQLHGLVPPEDDYSIRSALLISKDTVLYTSPAVLYGSHVVTSDSAIAIELGSLVFNAVSSRSHRSALEYLLYEWCHNDCGLNSITFYGPDAKNTRIDLDPLLLERCIGMQPKCISFNDIQLTSDQSVSISLAKRLSFKSCCFSDQGKQFVSSILSRRGRICLTFQSASMDEMHLNHLLHCLANMHDGVSCVYELAFVDGCGIAPSTIKLLARVPVSLLNLQLDNFPILHWRHFANSRHRTAPQRIRITIRDGRDSNEFVELVTGHPNLETLQAYCVSTIQLDWKRLLPKIRNVRSLGAPFDELNPTSFVDQLCCMPNLNDVELCDDFCYNDNAPIPILLAAKRLVTTNRSVCSIGDYEIPIDHCQDHERAEVQAIAKTVIRELYRNRVLRLENIFKRNVAFLPPLLSGHCGYEEKTTVLLFLSNNLNTLLEIRERAFDNKRYSSMPSRDVLSKRARNSFNS